MREHECDGDDGKRGPRKRAKRYSHETVADQITEQKTAPEDLLDERNDDDESGEAENDVRPIKRQTICKNFGVVSACPRSGPEKRLGRNPNDEDDDSDNHGDPDPPW